MNRLQKLRTLGNLMQLAECAKSSKLAGIYKNQINTLRKKKDMG